MSLEIPFLLGLSVVGTRASGAAPSRAIAVLRAPAQSQLPGCNSSGLEAVELLNLKAGRDPGRQAGGRAGGAGAAGLTCLGGIGAAALYSRGGPGAEPRSPASPARCGVAWRGEGAHGQTQDAGTHE